MVPDQAMDERASAGPADGSQPGAAAAPRPTLNEELRPATSQRVLRSLALRTRTAGSDAFAVAPAQTDNGDEARYSDKSGTYTKGVLQSGIGLVDPVAYATFKAALRVGGVAVADINLNPDMDIPGENADVVETTLTPGADARKAFANDVKEPSGAPYELSGTINIPAAGKDFKFEHKSRLSPIPGIADAYR